MSLVRQKELSNMHGIVKAHSTQGLQLIKASGDPLPIVDYVRMTLEIGTPAVVIMAGLVVL